jgi:hypothetical protein
MALPDCKTLLWSEHRLLDFIELAAEVVLTSIACGRLKKSWVCLVLAVGLRRIVTTAQPMNE